MIVVFGGNCQLGRELARRATLQSIPMATLAHTEVDIAKSSAVASVPVGMCAPCTAPSEPGARRSGAGIGHLSLHRGGSDHLAWFCKPYRGRTGAAQRPQTTRDAHHDGGSPSSCATTGQFATRLPLVCQSVWFLRKTLDRSC